jgi:hypothetical protein
MYTLNHPPLEPTTVMNDLIRQHNNVVSNWNYRNYLQNNSNNIMKYNSMAYIQDSGNNPYVVQNTQTVNSTPHLYSSNYDSSDPLIGLNNSDLKQAYTVKQNRNARMIVPTIPTNF